MEQAAYQSSGAITLTDGRFHLQLDVSAFWTNFRQALVSLGNGELGSVADNLSKALGTIAQTNSIEHKAYQLVFSALQRACVAVIQNHPKALELLVLAHQSGNKSSVFYGDVSKSAGSGGYALGVDFFTEPQRHPLVLAVKEDYKVFLTTALELQPAHATVLAATLPDRFAVELAKEWQRQDYTALEDHFEKNPFWQVLERQQHRNQRHAHLLGLFAKPAFQDVAIALADMYIEPNFWVHTDCISEKQSKQFIPIPNEPRERPFRQPETTAPLHETVRHWLLTKKILDLPGENSPLLVLLGQPGQGKTSFCLRTADHLLREHPGTVDQLYLFRLCEATNHAQLIQDPLPNLCKQLDVHFEEKERDLPKTALRNSLLLLDGLDELYMSRGLTMADINNFLRNLRNQLVNHKDLNCRVIVTSRTHYLKMEDIDGKTFPVLHLADLSIQQQKEWLGRYQKHADCTLTAYLLDQIERNEGNVYGPVQELVRQPILLHLIALSGVNLDGKTNTAHIYKELFRMMIARKWSDQGQLEKYKKFEESDWMRFLRVLALSIFQSDHEYVRRKDFEAAGTALKAETDRLRTKAAEPDLEIQDFVRDLLVSFYFQVTEREKTERQRAEDHDHYAYEFLHKSLQECLVADHIWHRCKTQLTKRDEYNEYEISNASQALDLIAPLFEPKVISQEIADYLHEIIQNDPDAEVKKEVKAQCKKLLPGLLDLQFLKTHQSQPDQPGPLDKIVGNFYGLWSLASALIGKHELLLPSASEYKAAVEAENMIPEEGEKMFINLLVLTGRNYQRVQKLNYQDFNGADLSGANLSRANLNGADLSGANLSRANLNGADLSGANLYAANLYDANLSVANLYAANLRVANLRVANLVNANLVDANLAGVNLFGAKLYNANLCRANLSVASFNDADLRGVDLSDADLDGADLSGANLSGTNLSGANLSDADLSGANLHEADFENAIMDSTTGIEECLNKETVNFKGTIYENAPWAKK